MVSLSDSQLVSQSGRALSRLYPLSSVAEGSTLPVCIRPGISDSVVPTLVLAMQLSQFAGQ